MVAPSALPTQRADDLEREAAIAINREIASIKQAAMAALGDRRAHGRQAGRRVGETQHGRAEATASAPGGDSLDDA